MMEFPPLITMSPVLLPVGVLTSFTLFIFCCTSGRYYFLCRTAEESTDGDTVATTDPQDPEEEETDLEHGSCKGKGKAFNIYEFFRADVPIESASSNNKGAIDIQT